VRGEPFFGDSIERSRRFELDTSLFSFPLLAGSMPFAGNLRASSRRARASARLTSGKTPKAIVRNLSAKR